MEPNVLIKEIVAHIVIKLLVWLVDWMEIVTLLLNAPWWPLAQMLVKIEIPVKDSLIVDIMVIKMRHIVFQPHARIYKMVIYVFQHKTLTKPNIQYASWSMEHA